MPDKPSKARAYAGRQITSAKKKVDDGGFERDDHNRIRSKQRNIILALRKLGVRLSHDLFVDRLVIEGPEEEPRRHMRDVEVEYLLMLVEEHFRVLPSRELFWAVVDEEARRHSFHPVRDYLDRLQWDQVLPRIDQGGSSRSDLLYHGTSARRFALMRTQGRIRISTDERKVCLSPFTTWARTLLVSGP
jgi:hypothetical protein